MPLSFLKKGSSEGSEPSVGKPHNLFLKTAGWLLFFGVVAYFLRGTLLIWIPVSFMVLVLLNMVYQIPGVGPLLQKIVRTAMWITSIIIVILAAIWLYNLFSTGGEQAITAPLENIGVTKGISTTWAKIIHAVRNPTDFLSGYGDFSNPNVAEEKVLKGVEFRGIEARRDFFREDTPVTLYGSARINALENSDVEVSFDCFVNNSGVYREGEVKLLRLEGDTVTVLQGYDETIDFTCEIEDGLPINASHADFIVNKTLPRAVREKTNALAKQLNADGKKTPIQVYTVNLVARYPDFSTTSSLKVYTLTQEQYLANPRPFEGVQDPLLSSNGKTRSQCLAGCGLTQVALKTSTQPHTEIGTYSLGIGIKKDSDWRGEVEKLKSLSVGFPSRLRATNCEDFGGDTVLDDSDAHLQYLNERVIPRQSAITQELTLFCDYEVVEPRTLIGFDEILVRTTYDYRVETVSTVTIVGTEAPLA